MKRQDFLLLLDKMLEMDSGTLIGREKLIDLASWDSLAILSFIALIDREFGLVLSPSDISKAQTVDDLVSLLGAKIQ